MRVITCLHCGTSHKTQTYSSAGKYCSVQCMKDSEYEAYILRWKNGEEHGMKGRNGVSNHIRRYLFQKFNSKCTRCGWDERHPADGKVPLDVEHLDGDGTNNREENLDLLCPNCHSLTLTYKSRNRGNSTRKYNHK